MCRLFVSALILLGFAGVTFAQRTSADRERSLSPVLPLQVELLQTMDAGKLVRGQAVLAKTAVEWHDRSCRVRKGATVTGHITNVVPKSKQNKGSVVTIAFDHADCDGRVSEVTLQLYAIVAAPPPDEGLAMADSGGMMQQFSPKAPITLGGKTPPQPQPMSLSNDVSVTNHTFHDPSRIDAGDVRGMKQVTLSVGTGPNGASVVAAMKGNLRLEQGTQFVLMPPPAVIAKEVGHEAPVAPKALAPESVATVSIKPVPPPKPELDETEICSEGCNAVSVAAATKAALVLSTEGLGSRAHDHGSYRGFEFESTITYLDANSLLYTFDPHHLRHRTASSGFRTESMRTVRAVLLDAKTLKVKRIADWQVQGEGQFIWSASPGVILVHVGHRLQMLGANLKPIRELAVPGELAFVSVSPSAYYIAVGTLHERYTLEAYTQLKSAMTIEPEEDVDVQLVDGEFTPLLQTRQSSRLPAPVLSDTGEVRVNSAGLNRWLVSEREWNQTTRKIATTTSACKPNVEVPLASMVFVVGCDAQHSQNWYRMLRQDGHALLVGRGSSQEI